MTDDTAASADGPITQAERLTALRALGSPNPKRMLTLLGPEALRQIDAVALRLRESRARLKRDVNV